MFNLARRNLSRILLRIKDLKNTVDAEYIWYIWNCPSVAWMCWNQSCQFCQHAKDLPLGVCSACRYWTKLFLMVAWWSSVFFGLFLLRNGVWNVILTHSSNNEFQIFLASPVKKQGALFESYRGKNEFHCKIKIIFYAKYLSSLFWLVYISLCSVLRYFTFTFACFCMAKLYVLLTVSQEVSSLI